MNAREYQRIPFAVRAEFRTASSFLIAYSLNFSRGGMFLETDADLEPNSEIKVDLIVPGTGPVSLTGRVSWRRTVADGEGPVGVGVEFDEVSTVLGPIIDSLVASYDGINVVLYAADSLDRTSLSRMLKSILATAEVVTAPEPHVAKNLLTGDVDLAVIDVDANPDASVDLIRTAQSATPPIPVIALATSQRTADRARAAGACEVAAHPPAFGELQVIIVRALGRPALVTPG